MYWSKMNLKKMLSRKRIDLRIEFHVTWGDRAAPPDPLEILDIQPTGYDFTDAIRRTTSYMEDNYGPGTPAADRWDRIRQAQKDINHADPDVRAQARSTLAFEGYAAGATRPAASRVHAKGTEHGGDAVGGAGQGDGPADGDAD